MVTYSKELRKRADDVLYTIQKYGNESKEHCEALKSLEYIKKIDPVEWRKIKNQK
jgi:hypothetical protein